MLECVGRLWVGAGELVYGRHPRGRRALPDDIGGQRLVLAAVHQEHGSTVVGLVVAGRYVQQRHRAEQPGVVLRR
jgi:hypothetical protein